MNMTDLLGEIMSNPVALNLVSKLGFGANANSSQKNTQECDFDKDFADLTKKEQTVESNKTPPITPTMDTPKQKEDTPPINLSNFGGNQFETQPSVTETLFKPVEKIAGVELVGQLKKYYENWYVK